jgi:sugar phosphate permease
MIRKDIGMAFEKSKVKKVLSYRWAVFGILALALFVYFHRVSPAVVSTDLQTTFGVGAASIALLSSAYFYAYTIMQLPSGLLTDNLGPRKTVSIFTLVAAAGAILNRGRLHLRAGHRWPVIDRHRRGHGLHPPNEDPGRLVPPE